MSVDMMILITTLDRINDIPGKLNKIIDDGISFFSEKNRQSQTNPLDSDSE